MSLFILFLGAIFVTTLFLSKSFLSICAIHSVFQRKLKQQQVWVVAVIFVITLASACKHGCI